MPREQRKITFSPNELRLAVSSYGRVTPNFLPIGQLQSIRVEPSESCKLFITIGMKYGERHQSVELEAKAENTVELLVRACLENNIPIPRVASKSMTTVGGEITLVIHIASEEDRLAVPPESSSVVAISAGRRSQAAR